MSDYASDDDDITETSDEALLREAREAFECAAEREHDNRERGHKDLEFARLGKQWDPAVEKQRQDEGRPCLTYNTLPTFIRQVVNDARQNKPAIQVQPVDGGADEDTAEIFSGLIRNIEVSSDAEVAYDTAIDGAASNGFGYFRVSTAYTTDDTFDQDIVIERIANPFSVYGDPYSEAADSSDWDCAFVVQMMPKDEFRRKHKGRQEVDFDALGYTGLASPWLDGDQIMVAEYWKREVVEKQIVALSNGTVVDLAEYQENPDNFPGIFVVGQPRVVRSKKVTQYIVTGAEVLETNAWPGKYIPIVPVYGDEVNVDGKRELFSLVHNGIDPQRDYNYWRTTTTELIALAPKAPFIGEEGAFDADPNWSTANTATHPYLEHTAGKAAPQRQPFTGPPAAAIQQALQAKDDIKACIGLYDASLGLRSNETSGVAINARKIEGDVSTFHFIDNLTRAIRHCGRILIDLIPKVYSTPRVLRILGQDMKPQTVQISPDAQANMAKQQQEAHQQATLAAQQAPIDQQQAVYQAQMQERVANIARIYDITAGKYDLTVKAGPSFTTQREASRAEMVETMRAVPATGPAIAPMLLRNSDWPGADEAADKLEGQAANPAQQQVAQLTAANQQLAAENAALKQDQANKAYENQIKARQAETDAFNAETDRIRALSDANKPAPIPTMGSAIPQ